MDLQKACEFSTICSKSTGRLWVDVEAFQKTIPVANR